jgi:hypothetical protein
MKPVYEGTIPKCELGKGSSHGIYHGRMTSIIGNLAEVLNL